MNDIIKPFDFDLTKKLHGHVRVETRSRWTGRVVDSQEKENLVTNAKDIFPQLVKLGGALFDYYLPVYQKLLGGIMLFDNTLTEQASNIYFPASAKLIAFAGQDADASSSMCGSFNNVESIALSNGFTTVWDFLTSQANGTIASLARTSFKIKGYPLFAFSGGSLYTCAGFNTSCVAIGYDETNKYLYFVSLYNTTIGGVAFSNNTIYRTKYEMSYIGLTAPPIIASNVEAVKTLTGSDGSSSAYMWTYDKYANNFVLITGNKIYLVAIDGTATSKTITGVSMSAAAVTENYYWGINTSNTLYRISKANTADVQTFSVNASCLAPSAGDVVFAWKTNTNSQSIVYPDGTVLTVPAAAWTGTISQYSYNNNFPCYSISKYYSAASEYFCSNYLGTIANLDSPVTKTSSQTMKITYTLTEA